MNKNKTSFMNRKIILVLFALCFGGMMKAQQLPQITQYMINNYAVNPAVAGMQDYYQVKNQSVFWVHSHSQQPSNPHHK